MALPSWLNVTPQMFLQAAQAGGAQGLQVAQMRQQSAQQDAARQAAADELSARLAMSREAAMMDQVARQQAASQEGRALDIRERLGMAELAMREADMDRRAAAAQAENIPLELRTLTDPATGSPVGYGYGRNVRWLPEEVPSEGTPMVDASGNVVANRFGQRVIPIPRERSYSQAELDSFLMNPELDPRRRGAPSAAPVSAPVAVESERVTVVSPSGQIGTIPRSNLQRALQNGYRVQQ